MWREQAIRVIAAHDLYWCLLPQCKCLRTCRSGFPIATILKALKLSGGQFLHLSFQGDDSPLCFPINHAIGQGIILCKSFAYKYDMQMPLHIDEIN